MHSSHKFWDAVVVGGGPAGATTALLLARSGWRVAVVEAAAFPRPKVCGEYLSPALHAPLEQLGVLERVRRAAVELRKLRITAGKQRLSAEIQAPPHAVAQALSRDSLDEQLLAAAREAGAEVLTRQRVRGVHVVNQQATAVEIASRDHDPPRTLRTPLIIAADGRRSVVVRQTGRVRSPRSARGAELVGFKAHVPESAAPETLARDLISMHSLPGGYVGVCPIEHGATNLCGLIPAARLRRARGDIAAAVTDWCGPRHELARLLAARAAARWLTIPDIRRQHASPQVSGVLFVGDAHATIEPLTGQGITLAVSGAMLAARMLLEHGPAVDLSFAARYDAAWQARFRPSIDWAARIGWLLRRPSLLAPILGAASVAERLAAPALGVIHRHTSLPQGLPHLRRT